MANSEENGDGTSSPSPKRLRISSSGDSSDPVPVYPETQHQESRDHGVPHPEHGKQETQLPDNGGQENQLQEAQHQANGNQETEQHQVNVNQETQQHQESGNQETQQHQENENQETQPHQENGNQETSEEEDDEEDDSEDSEDGASEDDEGKIRFSKLNSWRGDMYIYVALIKVEVLDCPICCNPLNIPVFQCENGHTACSSCCDNVAHECPSCSMPIGRNRCWAVENVIESLMTACQNVHYGCKTIILYSKKNEHDKTCIHLPCSCPIHGCNFISSYLKLGSHLSSAHGCKVNNFEFDDERHIVSQEMIMRELANFSEGNGDRPSNLSSKRQRVSSSDDFSDPPVNQENQNQENGEQETQHPEREDQLTQHPENGDKEIQLLENENQETHHQGNGNQETQQQQENGNQETIEEEEDDDDDEEDDTEGEESEREDRLFELTSFMTDKSVALAFMPLEGLDCSICCYPLTIPVFQCENGHTACSSCRDKVAHGCPSCSMPVGPNRCWTVEKIIESVRIPCPNLCYGCEEAYVYSKKKEHDETCIHAPCSCPIEGCKFVGSYLKLDKHLWSEHGGSFFRFEYDEPELFPIHHFEKYIVLQEAEERDIFIVNNREEIFGNIITISVLGPSSRGGHFYELTVEVDLAERVGGSIFKFQSYMKSIQRRADKPVSAGLLLPPGELSGSSVCLELTIWRKGKGPWSTAVLN